MSGTQDVYAKEAAELAKLKLALPGEFRRRTEGFPIFSFLGNYKIMPFPIFHAREGKWKNISGVVTVYEAPSEEYQRDVVQGLGNYSAIKTWLLPSRYADLIQRTEAVIKYGDEDKAQAKKISDQKKEEVEKRRTLEDLLAVEKNPSKRKHLKALLVSAGPSSLNNISDYEGLKASLTWLKYDVDDALTFILTKIYEHELAKK
ncbi:hypothetical protein JXB27_02185 [Candidatus Woesearchaeota archaeon]|nr:hypothetical protein [Candidatus Woesearchaeota archaeon]